MAGLVQEIVGVLTAVIALFGGLAFWPLVRFGGGIADGAALLLKQQFHAHILLLAGCLVLLQYLYATGNPAAGQLNFLPYAVGGLSWAAALIILFGTGLWRRITGPGAAREE